MNLTAFCAANHLSARAIRSTGNPSREADDWARTANHWRVTLTHPEQGHFTLYFSQGAALVNPPTVDAVLECLLLDATSVENTRTFEEWAAEYGYDSDSRRAHRIWLATWRQTRLLRAWLGDLYGPAQAAYADLDEEAAS